MPNGVKGICRKIDGKGNVSGVLIDTNDQISLVSLEVYVNNDYALHLSDLPECKNS